MLTVDHFARVRRAFYQDKMSIRAIARTFGHSRRKIREALQLAEPMAYPPRQSPSPKLDPVKPFIDAILTADETAPRKQRHTGMQIFRRLVVEQSSHSLTRRRHRGGSLAIEKGRRPEAYNNPRKPAGKPYNRLRYSREVRRNNRLGHC